ncbi:MAG: GNAT family N-acetyltransferase [Raoultibacter sp.]
MELRKAEVSDLDYIMEILAQGRVSLAALGIDQWQGGYPHREVIEADIARGESFVAADESGLPVATAMIACRDEIDYRHITDGTWLTESFEDSPCYVVVHRVAVSPQSKNGGIAVSFLDHAAAIANNLGCASIRIDTHPGNVPMQKLLEKCGFTRCGIIYISHAEGATPERFAYEKLI